MQNQKARDLWDKYIKGEANPDESAMVESWYIRKFSNEKFEGHTDHERLMEETLEEIMSKLPPEKKAVKLWPSIAAAVVAICVLGAGLYFYKIAGVSETKIKSIQHTDLKPGSNRAILRLANGRRIPLDNRKLGVVIGDAQLTYSDGSSIMKSTGDIQTVIMETPRGGQYQATLPDGTHIWLNAASVIKFPSRFTGVNRIVQLSGEAYFEVAKDKAHPFIVKSNGQEVEVLGTHFNIEAYPDELSTKTTLLEGAVKVTTSPARGRDEVVLKPDQQAVFTSAGIKTLNADYEVDLAWKNGFFAFKDTPLEIVMRQISRWYDVDIEYENNNLKQRVLAGSVSRYKEVSGLLKVIEETGTAHFKIEKGKIIVGE